MFTKIVMPSSSNYWSFNLCARHHTLTVTIPIFLIFKRNCLNRHSEVTANPHRKRVIFNRCSNMTYSGGISLITKTPRAQYPFFDKSDFHIAICGQLFRGIVINDQVDCLRNESPAHYMAKRGVTRQYGGIRTNTERDRNIALVDLNNRPPLRKLSPHLYLAYSSLPFSWWRIAPLIYRRLNPPC